MSVEAGTILRGRILAFGAVAAAAAMAALLYGFNPAVSGFYPPCPFNALTGWYCPGCGSLRGLNLLLHGNLAGAFGSNPLMVAALPFVGYGLIRRLWAAMTGRPYRSVFVPSRWIWALLILIMVYWVVRNIPYFPFNYLAP